MGLKLVLTKEEETELLTITRGPKIESRLKDRTFLILDWRDGKTYDQTQLERQASGRVVAKWRKRFSEKRIDSRHFRSIATQRFHRLNCAAI